MDAGDDGGCRNVCAPGIKPCDDLADHPCAIPALLRDWTARQAGEMRCDWRSRFETPAVFPQQKYLLSIPFSRLFALLVRNLLP